MHLSNEARESLLEATLSKLCEGFDALAAQLSPPVAVKMGDDRYAYRYQEKSVAQALLQKSARVITGLRAIKLLNCAGLLQEQASLERAVDEIVQDIAFLGMGAVDRPLSDLHRRYLDIFYQEELDNPKDAVGSTQKRATIPRQKIRAYLGRAAESPGLDRSSTTENLRTIDKVNSGYLHAASPQVMELVYGDPPAYRLQGSTDSPLYADHVDNLLNYFYRGVLALAIAARAIGDLKLFDRLGDYAREFAVETGNAERFLADC